MQNLRRETLGSLPAYPVCGRKTLYIKTQETTPVTKTIEALYGCTYCDAWDRAFAVSDMRSSAQSKG